MTVLTQSAYDNERRSTNAALHKTDRDRYARECLADRQASATLESLADDYEGNPD